jgi:hypothetical protein
MRGLDEQVQEIKSDVLGISQELSRLEEKLLYPSGTEVAVFVALAKGEQMRLDAVRVQIDGQLVAHYIYSFKELRGPAEGRRAADLRREREHRRAPARVLVDGKLEAGTDYSHSEHFTFRKEVKPKLVGLTRGRPDSGAAPIALEEW